MKHFESGTTLQGAGFGDVAAANDDQGPVQATPKVAIGRVPARAGWDAFEIWRTRVRDARRELPEPRGS